MKKIIIEHFRKTQSVPVTWHWAQPLSQLPGPASSVRANEMRLNPPVKYNSKQRENFITTRVEVPLRGLPTSIMKSLTVNNFKNAYDNHTHTHTQYTPKKKQRLTT